MIKCMKFSYEALILVSRLFLFEFLGEWKLVDKCAGLCLVNRFNLNEVNKCLVHWGSGTVNLELWSEVRPVSKETPLRISHEYEVKQLS